MLAEVIPANSFLQETPEVTAYFTDFLERIDRGEKTTRTYLTNLKAFAAWMKYRGITQPERRDVISYRDWLQSEHESIALDPVTGWRYRTDRAGNRITVTCTPATVRAYMRSVKMFFSWTESAGLYANIAEHVRIPAVDDSHKKEALTVHEVQAVQTAITSTRETAITSAAASKKDTAGRVQRADEKGKRLFAMYLLAVNAGLRTIELHRANVRDLVIKDGCAWLYVYGKGHTEADTKKRLAPEVAQAVAEYLQSRADDYSGNSPLFVSTGNRSGGQRIATTTISTMLKEALKEAGIDDPRITPHSFRHTAGTAAMQVTGSNLHDTQHYMRHASPKTTEIYIHVDTEKTDADIADKIYAYYNGGDQTAGAMDKLQRAAERLTPEQLEQLAGLAESMA